MKIFPKTFVGKELVWLWICLREKKNREFKHVIGELYPAPL